MKRAETIIDIPNSFASDPLSGADLDIFYDENTMAVRTGDEYISPIGDIYDACTVPSAYNTFLLLGHRGCGKSTELNKLAEKLRFHHYPTVIIDCFKDLNLNNPFYSDLLILMGDALVNLAKEYDSISDADARFILDYWSTQETEIISREKSVGAQLSGEIGFKSLPVLDKILSVMGSLKGELKYSDEKREDFKKEIEKRPNEWLGVLNRIADQITAKCDGLQPIIIFEDLDKLDRISPEIAWDIFDTHGAILSGFTFPVIYTFPIALSYSPRYGALSGYFQEKILPMIKQKTVKGEQYKPGYDTMMNIISRRADLDLFEKAALDLAIEKTGGSLRDLFEVIRTASTRARRRNSGRVEMEDVSRALSMLKSELTRRIDGDDYSFLAAIHRGNKTKIKNRDKLLDMIRANAVLEYNGERWNDLHPLVADFLVKENLTDIKDND